MPITFLADMWRPSSWRCRRAVVGAFVRLPVSACKLRPCRPRIRACYQDPIVPQWCVPKCVQWIGERRSGGPPHSTSDDDRQAARLARCESYSQGGAVRSRSTKIVRTAYFPQAASHFRVLPLSRRFGTRHLRGEQANEQECPALRQLRVRAKFRQPRCPRCQRYHDVSGDSA